MVVADALSLLISADAMNSLIAGLWKLFWS
jgi:hypothetical protein